MLVNLKLLFLADSKFENYSTAVQKLKSVEGREEHWLA